MNLTKSQRASGFLLFASFAVVVLVLLMLRGDDSAVEYMLSR